MMRILQVSHKYPPHAVGGVEVYTHRLAHALKSQHQVAVFFRHDAGDPPASPIARPSAGLPTGATRDRTTNSSQDQEIAGVLTRSVSVPRSGWPATVPGEFFGTFLNRRIEAGFRQFIDSFQPDLIHFQHVMALSARLIEIARQTGKPVVLTFHDYWFICSNSQLIWPAAQICAGKAAGMNCVRCAAAARFPSPLVRWLRPALAPLFLYRDWEVRRAARRADQFLSPSQFLADQYIAAGFAPQRFIVLENGIDVARIQGFPWRPSDGPLRVTFLGSLAWQKGVHVLAEAFGDLPPAAARLRIWGNPTVFPEYSAGVRDLLTDPDKQLMGPIPNDQVGQVLADSDVMVVPSLWYENSPVVIQEARAAGVPVIASGHGALQEKVRHGVDGLHFPPGDAAALTRTLSRLLEEPDLLPTLRQGIPAPMDISDHVEQLETIYDQVIKTYWTIGSSH